MTEKGGTTWSVLSTYKRFSGKDGDIRTNYTINKLGETVELTLKEKEIAIKTAKVIGLEVAAIDLARCVKTGKVFVYEVNGNGSLKGFTTVTEINLAERIISFAEKKATEPKTSEEKTFDPVLVAPSPMIDDGENCLKEIVSFRYPSIQPHLVSPH